MNETGDCTLVGEMDNEQNSFQSRQNRECFREHLELYLRGLIGGGLSEEPVSLE